MTKTNVRALFPQLFANGYVPLPNKDKACLLPRWPTVEVNEARVAKWARGTRWGAIGLRVEPPLLVLDYDIPDPDIAAVVRATIPNGILAGLERIGKPPKTAFFLRLKLKADEEPFRKLWTRRYRLATRPGLSFAVEAFGGGAPHPQMGAFGPHSHDEFGAVKATYAWVDGRSPANVALADLPEVSRAEVTAALAAAEAVLAGWPGMEVDKQVVAAGGFQTVHDLDNESIFHDLDGQAYNLEELTEEAKHRRSLREPALRLTGSFTGDPVSTGSARAKVSWSPRTGLAVVDFKTGLTHRPVLILDEPEVQALFDQLFSKRGT